MIKYYKHQRRRFSSVLVVQVRQVSQETKAQGCHIGRVQGPKDSLLGTYATTGTGVGLSR